MVTVTLSIEKTPPDSSGTQAPTRDVIATTAESYDAALDELARQLPDGWREVAIHVDRGTVG